MSGNEEIIAAMGFTSFGRVHRGMKRKNTENLPQLIPGTELSDIVAEFPVNSVEEGPHGVVSLLCQNKDFVALNNALDCTKDNKDEVCKEKRLLSNMTLLQALEHEKEKFNELKSSQFVIARTATNNFETLGKHHFLNRSAMKLVAFDYIFQWTHAQKDRNDEFSFADICGGPGGFSEYLLWRMGQNAEKAHGYGITLKDAVNNCDWRLPYTYRNSMTICYGEDNTGDLYSIANIHNFRNVVRRRHPNGVHLALADGGFIDARSQVNQESMMTRLILAEVLAMFAVLRHDGDFICKTFELVTPAMIEICWILHQSFQHFAIVKPVTCRPASSERYIVARGLRVGHPTSKLVAVLEDRLVKSNSDPKTNIKLHVLYNKALLFNDYNFLRYLTAANEAIGRSQLQACRRINDYAASLKTRKARKKESSVDPRLYYRCWQLDNNCGNKLAPDGNLQC